MKTINTYFLSAMVIAFLTINTESFAQVGIGTTGDPDASSMLEIQSTTKGVLIPRMTTAQRLLVKDPDTGKPANGLLVFDTDTKSFWFYNGTATVPAWKELVSGNSLVDTDGDTRVEVEKTADLDEINFTANGTEYMQIVGANGDIKLGNRATSTDTPAEQNYTKITADGSLSYVGNATRWDDLRVPVTSLQDKGLKMPEWGVYKNNGSSSQGVYTFWFDKSTEEELFFTVQMPHAWKQGSTLKPHVHWVAKNTGTGLVGWGLEYIWTNVNDPFPANTSIIYGESIAPAIGGDTSVTANKHYITPMSEIVGTGKSLSSMLVCRIFRDATGIGTTDAYNSDAGMLQFDFHFEIDSDGSNEEYTKW